MAKMRGHCLCGAVSFATLMAVQGDRLTVTKGRDQIQTYREDGYVMGTIENDPGVRPTLHIKGTLARDHGRAPANPGLPRRLTCPQPHVSARDLPRLETIRRHDDASHGAG